MFLYHAVLDGLQTGHLAYPVSQFDDLYKILCEDDVNLTQLREQFQVISVVFQHNPHISDKRQLFRPTYCKQMQMLILYNTNACDAYILVAGTFLYKCGCII